MKVALKELLVRLIPQKITISGTTTTTGALSIPAQYQDRSMYGLLCTSHTSLVFRRDKQYITVMWQAGTGDTLIPRASTAVTVTAWLI